jgi:hypothetical protein
MMGVFDADGSELPIAAAVRRAAQAPDPTTTMPLPELDVEDYWLDPQGNFNRLWQAWGAQDEE